MLDLAHRQELHWLAQLVAEVRAAVPGVEPLLVGALARDLLLHCGHGLAIERATADVDLALAVADWDEFATVRAALLADGRFAAYRNTVHRLQHATLGWVDLIPFGAVERSDGTIAWPRAGDEVMAVIGYAEAAAGALPLVLPRQQRARVVALPLLAVLKLRAWKDRHRTTLGKDAKDLHLLLRHYLEAGNLDRLYGEFAHVLTERFDFEPTGACLLGRDVRATLRQHSARFTAVMQRLEAVPAPELDAEGRLTLVVQMAPHDPDRADRAYKLLAAFRAGLSGADAP